METRKRIAPPKTPAWVFSFIDGYHKALADSLYRESLVHGGLVDGVFYSTHSNRDDYYQKHGIQPSDFADDGKVKNRGHYWANHINKPYFIGQTTKEEQE